MKMNEIRKNIAEKMRTAGLADAVVNAFLAAHEQVVQGETGLVPETDIEPVAELPRLESLDENETASEYLKNLVVIKLNGGLGTSMGMNRAKSLIPIKGPDTFLDFIARQIIRLRRTTDGETPAFLLMNSFATHEDSCEYLRRYSELVQQRRLDFIQNKVPKIDAETFEPVSWPHAPEKEWCPPGHGDLYLALSGSGLLDQLLERGMKYLFVSNSDNLGATVDFKLLNYFARSGHSLLMEVCERTATDKKGGHLARRKRDEHLLLREIAQCPETDLEAFQDISRYRFFNTNNLWIRLDHVRAELERNGGILPLPLIINTKNVDPQIPDSPKVLQLESAMGAAIGCFKNTGAIVVPRRRFSPVKKTDDLLALMSDAYEVTEDFRLELSAGRKGHPPVIHLDSRHYKLIADFQKSFANGVPSLVECDSFTVRGPLKFESGVVCRGKVEFRNRSSEVRTVKNGTYRDCVEDL